MDEVRWTTQEELASVWVESESTLRDAITAAVAKIDERLQASPHDFGESRSNDRRVAFVPPLGFAFSVNAAQQQVKVLHVWSI